ncbi:hypothetical protein BH23PLA1_BH23PLA1_00930 [soil metagenome]
MQSNEEHLSSQAPLRRGGTTYLEVVIAISITGITLAGIGSASFSQLRLLRAIEARQYLLLPQGAILSSSPTEAYPEIVITYTGTVEPDDGALRGSAWRWGRHLGVARLEAFTPDPVGSRTWQGVLERVSPTEPVPFPAEEERNIVRLVEPGPALLYEGEPPVLIRGYAQVIEPSPPPDSEP